MDTEIRRFSYANGCIDPDEHGDLCEFEEVKDKIELLEIQCSEWEERACNAENDLVAAQDEICGLEEELRPSGPQPNWD